MNNAQLAQLQQLNADLMDMNSVLATNITNAQSVNKTNQANQQMVADTNAANFAITQNTNAANAAINEANIAFQKEENAITRQREDNAVQRRAADLVKAGLSKTLAAGDAASANALQAPQANIPMTVGHKMESSKNQAFQASAYTGFGNAMRANRQIEISDRALDIQEDELAIERQKLEHTKEYDQAVIDENKRYHDLMDKWEKDKLDHDSKFHDDALRLSYAELELENNRYLTDKDFKKIQNLYYKFQMYTGNKKLTAELAESAARTASYLQDVKLSKAQVAYVRQESRYVSVLVGNALVERGVLNASQKDTFVDTLTKMYNLLTAAGEGTTTGGKVVSKSEAQENSRDRLASGLSRAGTTALSVGAGIFIGAGGGKMIQKALGWDDHGMRDLF